MDRHLEGAQRIFDQLVMLPGKRDPSLDLGVV
jgi:hypothetical protein